VSINQSIDKLATNKQMIFFLEKSGYHHLFHMKLIEGTRVCEENKQLVNVSSKYLTVDHKRTISITIHHPRNPENKSRYELSLY
jgi:hypothetical protein